MSTTETTGVTGSGAAARQRLLAVLPVRERRLDLGGVPTAVLEGGDGPPMVLLHGPGEFAESWLRVVPDLCTTHRVIVPDLPGHGASMPVEGPLDASRTLDWLAGLVERTCADAPPVLVGRTLGGAIAMRFAAADGGRVRRLVLVDTLGLAPFHPAPEFGRALHDFLAAPSADSYELLMRRCSFDLDRLRGEVDAWEAFAAYALDRIRAPGVQDAMNALLTAFGDPVPDDHLARITVPTALIWGRHDLVTPLRVAEQAGARHGWPLHVVEEAADDPTLDRPAAFTAAVRATLADLDARPEGSR